MLQRREHAARGGWVTGHAHSTLASAPVGDRDDRLKELDPHRRQASAFARVLCACDASLAEGMLDVKRQHQEIHEAESPREAHERQELPADAWLGIVLQQRNGRDDGEEAAEEPHDDHATDDRGARTLQAPGLQNGAPWRSRCSTEARCRCCKEAARFIRASSGSGAVTCWASVRALWAAPSLPPEPPSPGVALVLTGTASHAGERRGRRSCRGWRGPVRRPSSRARPSQVGGTPSGGS